MAGVHTQRPHARIDVILRRLGTLARGESEGAAPQGVRRALEREGYVERREGELMVTVPLFATWIAEET